MTERDNPLRVLVAYGTKMGGTAGIASIIGQALADEGLEVEVRAAARARDLAAFDAVIVGGALYANRWHRDARRFVTRHTAELRALPVWLFSSGPLDRSASERDIPPTEQVSGLLARVGARGHVTFGGRLPDDPKGFVARAMVRSGRAGDWRDPQRVRSWAAQVATQLLTGAAAR